MPNEKQEAQVIKVKLELENLEEIKKQMAQAYTEGELASQGEHYKDKDELNDFFKFYNKMRNAFRGIPGEEASANTKAALKMTGDIANTSDRIADDIMKVMKTAVGIIEDIHKRIKQASPLLQSVESLFNLAVQLFFMPLGNKLATVMIPAIIQLVDDVMEMWDKIDGMDLGEMLTTMIDYGVKAFGNYFINLGEDLEKQGDLIGTLGSIMKSLGTFIKEDLKDLLKFGLNVLEWIFDNIGMLVEAFIEFKIASIALQTAQLAATIFSSHPLLAAAAAIAAVEYGAHKALDETGVSDMVNSLPGNASGRYVGATEGGRGVKVAEGGEGEFILPESKLGSMMDSISDRMVDIAQVQPTQPQKEESHPQTINNNFYINGYTDNELVSLIRSTVNEQVSQSRLRSGF